MIKFRMVKINTKQFAILAESAPTEFQLSLSASLLHDVHNRLIGISTTFLLTDENDVKVIVLELFCEFEIAPDDWANNIKDRTLTIPKDLLDYMLSQVVGVARGVIYCKTEGTNFNQVVLPPINVTQMIPEDMTINIE